MRWGCVVLIVAGACKGEARRTPGDAAPGRTGRDAAAARAPVAAPDASVEEGFAEVVAVDGGTLFACALLKDGRVGCWGRGDNGELGAGAELPDGCASEECAFPVEVAGVNDAIEIALGTEHACALRANGTVWCWGGGNWGQLGVKQPPDRCVSLANREPHACARAPVEVEGIADVVSIAAGSDQSCAVTRAGAVHCWGFAYGNVPAASGTCRFTETDDHGHACLQVPTKVRGVSEAVEVAVDGGRVSCARTTSGRVHCWGLADVGQLGDGKLDEHTAKPAEVAGIADAVELANGGSSICARLASGHVQCWGDGRAAPSPVLGANEQPLVATDLWMDGIGGCAKAGDGGVWCWGASRRDADAPELIRDPCPSSNDAYRCEGAVRVDAAPIVRYHPLAHSACVLLPDGRARCERDGAYRLLPEPRR